MAISLTTALRTTRSTSILTALDAGSGASKVKIYSGSVPANVGASLGGATLLGTLICSDPSGVVASGVLTMDVTPVIEDSSADATGTASFFRHTDSDDAAVLQGTVGTSGADLNLNTVNIVALGPIQVTSYVLTEGNA